MSAVASNCLQYWRKLQSTSPRAPVNDTHHHLRALYDAHGHADVARELFYLSVGERAIQRWQKAIDARLWLVLEYPGIAAMLPHITAETED